MPNGLLHDDSLRPHPDGLALRLTIPWYRSLWLSSVTTLALSVDGERVDADDLRVEFGDASYGLDELLDGDRGAGQVGSLGVVLLAQAVVVGQAGGGGDPVGAGCSAYELGDGVLRVGRGRRCHGRVGLKERDTGSANVLQNRRPGPAGAGDFRRLILPEFRSIHHPTAPVHTAQKHCKNRAIAHAPPGERRSRMRPRRGPLRPALRGRRAARPPWLRNARSRSRPRGLGPRLRA